MRKISGALGVLLLLTPSWLALFFAIKPGYEPGLGLLLGLTAVFWGPATLIGWGMALGYCIASRARWVLIACGALAALLLNIGALGALVEYEEVKRENHFADNRQFLELLGDKILSHEIDVNTANKMLDQKRIIFTVKTLFEEGRCGVVTFFAVGALDSQRGYHYQHSLLGLQPCPHLKHAQPVTAHWSFGAI